MKPRGGRAFRLLGGPRSLGRAAASVALHCALCLLCSFGGAFAQSPLQAAILEHERWFDRSKERPDLLRGSFDVLRFVREPQFLPAFRRDEKDKKRILDPDFYCTRCAKEGRIAEDRAFNEGAPLMDRDADGVLGWLDEEVKGATRNATLIEDDQFILWSDMEPLPLKRWPQRFLAEELVHLSRIFPEVSDKTTILNSHQRAHLYLIRARRLLNDMFWLYGRDAAAIRRDYSYLGPYLGMNNKQQVFLFSRERDYNAFAAAFLGRTSPSGQCWHLFQARAMVLLMTAEHQTDPHTTNAFLHRLSHNLLDAYRMYAYKLPAWLHMGLAHWIERRETTEHNTYCFSEGGLPKVLMATRWEPRVRKMLLKGDVRPLSEVMSFEEYSRFDLEEHFVTWSWACFLLSRGPEKMQQFINAMKSKKPEDTLRDIQVQALKEIYGLSLLQFDTAWREWVLALYPAN